MRAYPVLTHLNGVVLQIHSNAGVLKNKGPFQRADRLTQREIRQRAVLSLYGLWAFPVRITVWPAHGQVRVALPISL
jgi:hypothetical protein